MTPAVLAILTLAVGVPLNLVVTIMLVARSRANPTIAVLRERAVVALLVLLSVIVFGLIFVNNDTKPPWIDLATTKWITRAVILTLGIIPALYWLAIYRRHE